MFPTAFVAVTVNVETPGAEAVPLMTPVEEPKLRPAGSVPLVMVHVIGLVPDAAKLVE